MNVNRLYVAQINVCTSIDDDIENHTIFYGIPMFSQNYKGKFCKKAIVYHTQYNTYVDLLSKEEYKLDLLSTSKVGELYIDMKVGLKPLNDFYELSFERENMGRKKIIKTLSKCKLLNEKEDDK